MTIAAEGRAAEIADAETVGRLLHDFNTEFDEPTPGPHGVAVLRFRNRESNGALDLFYEREL